MLRADYVARSLFSVGKARFVRTHKLDLLMVLLPMLRLLRIFLSCVAASRR